MPPKLEEKKSAGVPDPSKSGPQPSQPSLKSNFDSPSKESPKVEEKTIIEVRESNETNITNFTEEISKIDLEEEKIEDVGHVLPTRANVRNI